MQCPSPPHLKGKTAQFGRESIKGRHSICCAYLFAESVWEAKLPELLLTTDNGFLKTAEYAGAHMLLYTLAEIIAMRCSESVSYSELFTLAGNFRNQTPGIAVISGYSGFVKMLKKRHGIFAGRIEQISELCKAHAL